MTSAPALLLNASLAIGILIALALAGRIARTWRWTPQRLVTFLESPWAPVVAGLLSTLIVRFVWRSFGEPGVVHDERAYLLQAEIFARGRWTAPTPPLPDFFEQMHVFVSPAVFAKYPPAHALMLVPGIWLGMPGLVPALLAGCAGALTFWLARRFANVWTAVLAWMLWTTAPATLVWATTYLSESTSVVMWLTAAWCTVRWFDTGRQRYLIAVAGALAWGFETRPLTMVALAVPLAFAIARRTIETRQWRAVAAAVLVGTVLLSLGPLWNRMTLGTWWRDPYSYYSRVYFPFDIPGFGVDATPPLRTPAELSEMGERSRMVHAGYVPSAIPVTLAARILAVLVSYGQGWRLLLVALLIGSVVRARGPARFCAASAASLFLSYLVFAHPPRWVVYYAELLPALHFLAAVQLVRLLGGSSATPAGEAVSAVAARASLAAALVILPFCVSDLVRVRADVDKRNGFHRQAALVLRRAPAHSLVFVRYSRTDDPNLAVTRNEADLGAARSWIVYDRGSDNARLLALASGRTPYLLDVSTWRLEPLR